MAVGIKDKKALKHARRYDFPQSVVLDVLRSLKIDVRRKCFKSIKAVCSDGKIRTIHLKCYQRGYYLKGAVLFSFIDQNVYVSGYVDMSEYANRHTNVGVIFIADYTKLDSDVLPYWNVPTVQFNSKGN